MKMRMSFREIEYFAPINEVDQNKVNEIAESIKVNGFKGCPILVCGESLITGSHRLTALKQLAEQEDNDEIDYIGVRDLIVAADVTDLVEKALSENPDRELDTSDIGWVFEGTWVEKFRDEIEEW
jgi:ParB-like chromosome segregation protein Spo0J